jgi:hypothetical protein
MVGYTQRQFEQAKRARELYHIVGMPTIETFKMLIKMNANRNCPVKAEDVNIAEKIFGAHMSSLKGKSTRQKSTPVREDTIKIPEELIAHNCKIELCIDIMYVTECGFMTMIDQTIRFRSAIPIDNRTHEECYCVLDMVLCVYNSAGFHNKTIHCDGEFRAMIEKVKDNLGVRMNFTNALDHVPEAERNNRTIKERVRAAYHRLPYKALPRTLIRYLVTTQASQLNLFPAKGGISPYYSPRTILGLPVLDYNKHCTVPFGAYVQANHEMNQTNSNAARTIDAIYLHPAINMQGGHELYDFNSNRVITRARVTQIPVTDMVIKAIERIAKDQGFKTLQFKNRKGAIFHDADWIAGVDYNDNIPQDAEDDKTYDDDESEDPEDDENINDEYDRIDEDELEDLIEDKSKQTNPNQHLEDEEQGTDKAKKKKNQKTTERPSYPNKKRNRKEANLEDLQERADQC